MFICMQISLVFIRTEVLHKASFWNRGTRLPGNGLLIQLNYYQIELWRSRNICYVYCAENGPKCILLIWTLWIQIKLRTNLDILTSCDYNTFIHVIRCGSSHQLSGYLDIATFSRKWLVLVGPGWRKPIKCIPGLLWHDVIQWRMDHVLHYWWICQTQDWSHIQRSVSLWKGRLQDQL